MTKAEQKYIKQLQQKKYRQQYKAFVVEGWKSILDFLKAGFQPEKIWAVDIPQYLQNNDHIEQISPKQLQQISFLKHPKDALAVFKMPENKKISSTGLVLVLDDLQDPGNLGTIIRTADWFGIRQIVCSLNTVDCYNPKVVQATMGALANVSVIYTDLQMYLQKAEQPVYGTFLGGQNIYKTDLPEKAIVVIGNEGNGISPAVGTLVNHKITIPKSKNALAESLNASVASAIIMSEYFRRHF